MLPDQSKRQEDREPAPVVDGGDTVYPARDVHYTAREGQGDVGGDKKPSREKGTGDQRCSAFAAEYAVEQHEN